MNEHLQNIKLEPRVKISRKCNNVCSQLKKNCYLQITQSCILTFLKILSHQGKRSPEEHYIKIAAFR